MRRCNVPLKNFEVLPIHTNRKHVWELIQSVLDLGGSDIRLGQTKCYWLEGARIRFWIQCAWVTQNGSNGGPGAGCAERHAGAGPDAEGPTVWRWRGGYAGGCTDTCPGRPSPGPAPTGTARDPDRYCPSYKSLQSSGPGLLSRVHLETQLSISLLPRDGAWSRLGSKERILPSCSSTLPAVVVTP